MKKLSKILLTGAMMILPFLCLNSRTQAKDAKGNIVVVIDAGHGEADPGSIGTTQVRESDCNLAIAKSFQKYLARYDGVKVYLTRSEDEWMTNTGRAMIASSLYADFLISVHNNSGSDTNSGSKVIRSINPLYAEATDDMGKLITASLEKIGIANGGTDTRPDDKYTQEDYYTLIGEGVRAGIPSIIIEHLFLSNPNDCALISNDDGTIKTDMTDKIGRADAEAVAEYFKLKKREATADDKTNVTLNRNYSVLLSAKDGSSAEWYSSDTSVATVDSEGLVTAVGQGVANIVYKVNGENGGSCTITVEETKPKTLTGGLDPTFYETDELFGEIKTENAFGFVTYTDGTSRKYKLDKIGEVDKTKTGVQDIPVSYNELNGTLRIIHNDDAYTPEVTKPAHPDEEPETTEAETKPETKTDAGTKTDEENKSSSVEVKSVVKYVLVLVIVLLIGAILYVLENRNSGLRHRRRR